MEVVISWIQRSGELSARLNNIKHSMTDINNKETNEQTIQAKLQLIKVRSPSPRASVAVTDLCYGQNSYPEHLVIFADFLDDEYVV